MHLHILGLCGTFMGGLALLAKQLGHHVTGSDQHVYPPMSTQLREQGIVLCEGYRAENLDPRPDLVIIGNALSRGNPEVEAVLNRGLPYTSGPQWLAEAVLHERWVLAVAGTHGKTTTTSMLSWILAENGYQPGFLVGGIPNNFGVSAQLGATPFFVIEADEYDTAFFDKRSKFVHYRPRTAILNNLEYDHADIFDSIADIQRQFHHLVRTVPGEGLLIVPRDDRYLAEVLVQGCWTPVVTTALHDPERAAWGAVLQQADGSAFTVYHAGQPQAEVVWSLTGAHNVANALAAIAAAQHVGVTPHHACRALCRFTGVKRRLEVVYRNDRVTLYDDFAHHPTAIQTTLQGLRARVGSERIIVVLEPRSNTMRLGVHRDSLIAALHDADSALLYQAPTLQWDLHSLAQRATHLQVYDQLDALIAKLCHEQRYGGHIVLMSNGSFGGLRQKLAEALAATSSTTHSQ